MSLFMLPPFLFLFSFLKGEKRRKRKGSKDCISCSIPSHGKKGSKEKNGNGKRRGEERVNLSSFFLS